MANEDNLKPIQLDLISTTRPVSTARLEPVSDQDWRSLCQMAKQHRIAPMLQHRIQLLGLSNAIPIDVVDEWSAPYRKSALRYLFFRKTLARLSDILEKEQFVFAALKGAWLCQYAYENPALRPLRDIGILVEPKRALATYALLEKNGFARPHDYPMPLDGALDHAKHLPPLRCADSGIYLEVHTRLMGEPPDPAAKGSLNDISLLFSRRDYRDGIPYLSPTETLLHLIVHAA
jgi:hypothetical protein